jgi:hypothetical protein
MKTLTNFIPTGSVDKIVREGSPKEVGEVIKEFALSYPLLKLAQSRKDLSKEIYARIIADIKAIREQNKEEII